MGSCTSKQINDVVQTSFSIIHQIVELEKSNNDTDVYKNLLNLLYNIDKYDKPTQKIILQYVENKTKE